MESLLGFTPAGSVGCKPTFSNPSDMSHLEKIAFGLVDTKNALQTCFEVTI